MELVGALGLGEDGAERRGLEVGGADAAGRGSGGGGGRRCTGVERGSRAP